MEKFKQVIPSFSVFKVTDLLYDLEYYFSTKELAELFVEKKNFKLSKIEEVKINNIDSYKEFLEC